MKQLLNTYPYILTEFAVLERLRRSENVCLHPSLEHSLLIYDEIGKKEIALIYDEYFGLQRNTQVPFIIFTPTWRANKERVDISKDLDGKSKVDLSKCSYKNSLQKHWDGDLDLEDVKNSLKSVMWRNIGIEREGKCITEAVEDITHWSKYILHNEFSTPLGWEIQNMLSVTRLICISALKRCESRGVHYRLDFPECDDKEWKKHIIVCNGRYDFISC